MYTGTLIEDLMAAVERSERRACAEAEDLERWYASAPCAMAAVETNLAGVA
jgi:hypothetical protein